MQRFYETIFVARQDITANQVEALAKQYTTIIKQYEGEVTKTEFCGLRNLAYKMNKNRKGHYVLMNIAVKPAGIQEIERMMKLNEDILRYLSVRVEQLDNAPSALMQNRGFRDDSRDAARDERQSESLIAETNVQEAPSEAPLKTEEPTMPTIQPAE